MDQLSFQFKTEWELVLEGAARFEQWMKEEDEKREGGVNNEKTRQNYVNPGLFVSGDRIFVPIKRGSGKLDNNSVKLNGGVYLNQIISTL